MAEWRDVPGLGGKYQVTADGRVRLLREVNHVKQRTGYLTVQIFPPGVGKAKLMSVHRLVALAWLPNPLNLPVVNHIDGNRANPAAANLEWCTQSHNTKRAWASGRARFTAAMRASLRRASAKSADVRRLLSATQLRAARARIVAGEQQMDVAQSLGVGATTLASAMGRMAKKEAQCQS